ncbi:hypothetical protein B0H14DRAFT_3865271 [Mycena olivaceomarginata]|nr:hypothetical protein B0H14DRAFT_3865271 [Mycena olivaceomarginata]
MEHALVFITIATFVKDLIELGSEIKDSIDRVGENKEELSKLRDEVTGTLDGLTTLTQGFNNAQPSLELLTALEDLKNHLKSVHSKCQRASQHSSWFKSWWNRNKIDREIKRLHDLKKDCHDQFALFSTARTEGKVDRIADTTTRIESAAVQLADTTARIEGSTAQFTGVIARIKDSTTRIDQGTAQLTGTTARTECTVIQIADTTAQITDTTTRIEGTTIQIVDTTAQITATTTRIETGTAEVARTAARLEDSTTLLVDTTSRIEHAADEVEVMVLQQKLERWLEYPPNMKRRQDDMQELQYEGTGAWFLGGDQFKGWKDKPGSLWIQGDSGTGKSVLSSTVIRELFSEGLPSNTAIAYFYFDFRDEKSQRVKVVLQSVILQLSAQSLSPYSTLDRLYKSYRGQTLPTHENLLAILDELLSNFEHTYIVLDALDECNEHDGLVRFITRLRDWFTRSLHLLFTSQPREIFTEAFKHVSRVTLTPHITQNDIRRFINSELHSLSHLTRRMRAEEIVDKVVKKSNGMFRLAALLLMELRDAFSPDLHAILTSFPDNLFGVYSRFLQRIHPTAVFYVLAVLRWLTFSSELVTMAYLEDALAFDFLNPSEFVYDPARWGENAGRVYKMLEGLIVVNREWDFWGGEDTRTVTLAHASVEDYFRSEKFAQEYPGYDLRAGPSHRFLAQTCLGYLLQFADHPLICETQTNYPLGPYAAENWYYHLHHSDNPMLLLSLVVCLLQDGSSQYAAFNDLRQPLQDHLPVTKPLSVCSQLGYTEAVRFLLQDGADPSTEDNGYTALQAASRLGQQYLDIVHILLQSGANVNTVALEQARTDCYWNIVRMLLQEGSIPMLWHKWITDELEITLKDNRLETVQIMLEAWIHLGGTQVPPHHLVVIASEQGQSDSVRLLLEHGADVNAADKEYSALCAASLNGHFDTIHVLLEKGAELLLEHGADVNATGGMHGSALQAASRNGHVDIVRLLLEKDADVNAIGGLSGTALKAAARLDQLGGKNCWHAKEITRILLENGAHEEDMTNGSEEDVDARDSSSDTWSNAAAVSDNEDAMLDSSSDDSPPSESDD